MTGREHRFDRLPATSCSRASRAITGSPSRCSMLAGCASCAPAAKGCCLLKVTGSSFTRFARDDYTTLPERVDRPLFVRMDVWWRYGDPEHDHIGLARGARGASQRTFDEFVSESIQHLVHEMGTRLLARWPQLSEVRFEAENHTREPAARTATASSTPTRSRRRA